MASRPTVTTLTSGAKYTTSALNLNFQALRDWFDTVLGINGTSGSNNTMTGDIDFGGKTLRNYIFAGGIVGLNWRGPWVTTTTYAVRDLVSILGSTYICIVAHTAGTFSTDLSAAKWQIFAEAGSSSGVTTTAYTLTLLDDANAAEARATLGLGTSAVLDVGTSASKIVQLDVSAKLPAVDGSQLTGLSSGTVLPPGTITQYAGSSEPSGWFFCAGQTKSRTTEAALFAAIGTTYGVGDGSTTFNLPDARGRVGAGRDDMGGSAASRLTTGGSGINGVNLGANGGAQNVALVTAELAAHTHTGGAHTHGGVWTDGAGQNIETVPTLTVNRSGTTASGGAVATTSTGSGTAHQNTQPTIVFNTLIKN